MIRNPYRAYHVIIKKDGQETGRVHFETQRDARLVRDERRRNFPEERVSARICNNCQK